MTTDPTTPAPVRRVVVPSPAALVRATLATVVVGALAAGGAAWVSGSASAGAAAVGAAVTVAFFAIGSFFLHAAAAIMPQASLALAMLTYFCQVLALLLLFVGAQRAGWPATQDARAWFAGSVIAATVAWTVTHIVAYTRLRILAFDDTRASGPAGSPASTPGRGTR